MDICSPDISAMSVVGAPVSLANCFTAPYASDFHHMGTMYTKPLSVMKIWQQVWPQDNFPPSWLQRRWL